MNLKTIKEQLEIAIKSTCPNELEQLHSSQYMNVRRAVARNPNVSVEIVNTLATDPVLNVSYMALKNPKATINRDLSDKIITYCVMCEKDERYLECTNCEHKKVH